jgi:hypothetical protein
VTVCYVGTYVHVPHVSVTSLRNLKDAWFVTTLYQLICAEVMCGMRYEMISVKEESREMCWKIFGLSYKPHNTNNDYIDGKKYTEYQYRSDRLSPLCCYMQQISLLV